MKSTFKKVLSILMILAFSYNLGASPVPANEKNGKVNASELVKKSERAVAYIVKSGQSTADSKLKRSNKDSDPFWSSVKKLNESIEKLNKCLFLKDEGFNAALGEAVTAKEQVLTTYELLEANDAGVKEGIDKVSGAIDLLYENYSKESQRAKNGEPLSEKERENLEKIKSQNKELQKKLDELESKVGDNKKMIKKLKKIRNKSNEVAHCDHSSAGFFFAMTAMNMINGWMWGCHWWWGPWGGWYPGFYYGFNEIYIGIYDDYAYDWGYLDGVIDSSDYDLEVDLPQYEVEELDDYLNGDGFEEDLYESPLESNDSYDLNDIYDTEGIQDGNDMNQDSYDLYDGMEIDEPIQQEIMEEPIEVPDDMMFDDGGFEQFDQMDYMDSFSDFEY